MIKSLVGTHPCSPIVARPVPGLNVPCCGFVMSCPGHPGISRCGSTLPETASLHPENGCWNMLECFLLEMPNFQGDPTKTYKKNSSSDCWGGRNYQPINRFVVSKLYIRMYIYIWYMCIYWLNPEAWENRFQVDYYTIWFNWIETTNWITSNMDHMETQKIPRICLIFLERSYPN